jgi:ABC-type phosphate transport system permease subunit
MSSSAPPASEKKPGVSPRVVAALVLIVVVIVVSGLIGAAIGAIARHRRGRQPPGTPD